MKKRISRALGICLILTILAATLSGCAGLPSVKSPGTLTTTRPPASSATTAATTTAGSSTDVTTSKAGSSQTPAFISALARYQALKSGAFTLLSDKMGEDPALSADLMTMASAAILDLYLLPINYLASLEVFEGQPSTLGALLMVDGTGQIDKQGDQYIFSASSTSASANFSVRGEYDEKADSLQYYYQDNGKDVLFFEFTKAGDGYASQYYLYPGEGEKPDGNLMKIYTTKDAMYLGISDAEALPPSIYGAAPAVKAAFIAAERVQYILEDGQLTTHKK